VREEAPCEKTEAQSSKWQPVFEAVLRQILEEYEVTEAKVRDGMEAGMRKMFESPYIEQLQTLKGSGAQLPTLEEAQQVLFVPKLSDMRYYVAAFRRQTPDATARKEKMYKFKLMSVFYTYHRKDGPLMDRFMHFGGLESLAILLGEDHNVIQSQVIELLIELLSPMMSLQPASSSRQSHLYHQVYRCLRSASFWQNIAKIIGEPHELFPKSHANCIKLIAGAVGWLRPPEGVLPESGTLLGAQDVEDSLERLLASSGSALSNSDPETRHLAQELISEFKQQPVVRADPMKKSEVESAESAIFAPEAQAREDAAHAWQSLRKLGNDAIKVGLIWPAEAAYRFALEEGGRTVPSKEASLIESNRALALFKAGHHLEAAAAAERALERDPRNAKAAYRRAQALLDLPSAGAMDFQAALEAASLAAKLEPKDVNVAKVFQRAQKVVEDLPAQPLSTGHAEAGYTSQEVQNQPVEPATALLETLD
jgi:hypothetical protein